MLSSTELCYCPCYHKSQLSGEHNLRMLGDKCQLSGENPLQMLGDKCELSSEHRLQMLGDSVS